MSAAHFRLEGAFKSHGTGVAVRLLAIDKVLGPLVTTVVQRGSLVELLPFIELMPERLPVGSAGAGPAQPEAPRTTSRGPLFKAVAIRAKPTPIKQAQGCWNRTDLDGCQLQLDYSARSVTR